MEVFHNFEVDSKDAVDFKSSLGKDYDTVLTVGLTASCCSWPGVLDYLLHSCRSAQKLRRKLVTPLSDFDILCRLLLQEANRKLTSDSSFTRSELYELKSYLQRIRSKGEYANGEESSTVEAAAKLYKDYLTRCNLVDIWQVCTEYTNLKLSKVAVILSTPPSPSDLLVLGSLGVENSTHITLQDSTLIKGEEISLKVLADERESIEKENLIDFGLSCPGVEAWISFVRLLVNSRDDLSLARLVIVSGLLTHAQCQAVRKETSNTSLTMLQYLVSYTTQTELGGKSYAPGEEHPFVEFQAQILDLVKLVESAQTKVESIKDPETAVQKVTLQLKTWLQKRGVKTQCDIVEVWDTAAKILKERNADANGTPGRGLFGKAVVNMLTGLVDLYSSLSPEIEKSSEEKVEAKTPARSKKLAQFFRTPAAGTRSSRLGMTPGSATSGSQTIPEEDEFDKLVDLEGVSQKLKRRRSSCQELKPVPVSENDCNTPVRPQYTRYKSTMAWAEESSPVPESADRSDVRVFGSTLMAAGGADSPSTPLSAAAVNSVNDILKEIKDKQEKERKEETEILLKKWSKPLVAEKKSRKRILVKEAEHDMMEKYGVENKKPKPNPEDKEAKKTKALEEKKKKKLATPKGQKKLTSFFTKA